MVIINYFLLLQMLYLIIHKCNAYVGKDIDWIITTQMYTVNLSWKNLGQIQIKMLF